MNHLDLFSGIGGFALAVESVWPDAQHIFVEIDPFCQKVLQKNFPNSTIHGDIKTLEANDFRRVDLLTGGFPCQPFSVAGKQRAEQDDRFLWPQMLRITREVRPTWIVGENVPGIIELALEQVCADLEAEGYEVQPLIIPACAVNAPHRRDRVWIIARNAKHNGLDGSEDREGASQRSDSDTPRAHEALESSGSTLSRDDASDGEDGSGTRQHDRPRQMQSGRSAWEQDWPSVAAELRGVDDGLPVELDGFKLTKAQHRAAQLKGYGNAIVPQVAVEILAGIKAEFPVDFLGEKR